MLDACPRLSWQDQRVIRSVLEDISKSPSRVSDPLLPQVCSLEQTGKNISLNILKYSSNYQPFPNFGTRLVSLLVKLIASPDYSDVTSVSSLVSARLLGRTRRDVGLHSRRVRRHGAPRRVRRPLRVMQVTA